jgi:hypothetical protein
MGESLNKPFNNKSTVKYNLFKLTVKYNLFKLYKKQESKKNLNIGIKKESLLFVVT